MKNIKRSFNGKMEKNLENLGNYCNNRVIIHDTNFETHCGLNILQKLDMMNEFSL